MAITQFVAADNVSTTLATAASSTATTFTLASSANLPTLAAGQAMPLTMNDAATGLIYEVVYVTAISGVTLTVVRAQEGTGAQNWNIGDYAFCAPTSGTVATALGNPNNAFQVAPATQSQHAVQFGQLVANIGDRRNLLCDIPAASASATFTAESVVVGTAVGGLLSLVTNLNASINLGTVGAGGMDVSGLPATSSVAVYLIRNQVTGAVALLGQNASAVVPTSVYSGAAMPSGYTQSALLTILLVTSSQFGSCYVQERHVTLNQINQVTTGSSSVSNVLLSLGVPYGAKAADLNVTFACSAVTNANFSIGGTSTGTLGTTSFQVAGGSGSGAAQIRKFFLRTIQTVWYSITNSAGSPTTIISLVGYDI
jgi:hypothetical protein